MHSSAKQDQAYIDVRHVVPVTIASLRPLHREATLLANAKPELIHTIQGSSGHQLKDAHAQLYMLWSDIETSAGSDKPLIQSHND